jgi:hypothetical protein
MINFRGEFFDKVHFTHHPTYQGLPEALSWLMLKNSASRLNSVLYGKNWQLDCGLSL